MANKSTKRARRGCPKLRIAPLTNSQEVTLGSGEGRGFGVRNAEPIFKGKACDCSRKNGKNKWVGALRAEKGLGQGKNLD